MQLYDTILFKKLLQRLVSNYKCDGVDAGIKTTFRALEPYLV